MLLNDPTRRRILVVEDEYLIASEIVDAVEHSGGVALGPCASIESARRLLSRTPVPPDGAVLDINLRGDSISPLAYELAGRGVPLIYYTGYDTTAAREGLPDGLVTLKPMQRKRFVECLSRRFGPPGGTG